MPGPGVPTLSSVAPAAVTVAGHGSTSAAPDVVELSLAAEAQDGSVQIALDQATTGISAMRSALQGLGIAAADLQSTDAYLNTETVRDLNGAQFPLHHARFGLRAVVRDVEQAGALIGAALAAAGETGRMNGLSFAHSDPSSLLTVAREAAFADARAKAEQYAQLAGRTLGQVVEVSEYAGGPAPVGRAMAMASMPVSGGSLDVGASVTVGFDWA